LGVVRVRLTGRRRAIALATLVACACVGTLAPAALGSEASAHHRAAVRDARRLLTLVNLPAGALRTRGAPSGVGAWLFRPGSTSMLDVVDAHSWWRVPGSAATVMTFIATHRPRGSAVAIVGSTVGGSRPPTQFESFSWPAAGTVLGTHSLVVQVVGLAAGSTAVRVDAQVQWIIPRPRSERVPAGVREVDIARGAPGQAPTVAVRVTAPAKVREIISMIDRLPTVQPGSWSCPAELAGTPRVTFAFRADADGPALALASEDANVTEPTTPCDPLSFSVDGTSRTPLLRGAALLQRVERLVGVTLSN